MPRTEPLMPLARPSALTAQANTEQSSDSNATWFNSLQNLVAQQQTPIWNTLSLQMAHNRQMQESILSLPQLLVQSQNQFLQNQKQVQSSAATAPQPSTSAACTDNNNNTPALHHSEPYDEVSDDECAAMSYNEYSEADFEEFSENAEAGKPLTLVERLEKLYARLPHLAPPPAPTKQVAPSVRDPPEVEGRVKSLPAPPLILDTFQRFRASYRNQEGSTPTLDPVTGEPMAMEEDGDIGKKKKALTSHTKKGSLQFRVHNAKHPQCAKLDVDYDKLFPEYAAKLFRLSYGQMNMIQTAASYTLDACCHLDALLLGVRRCLESTEQKLGEYDYESDEEFTNMTSDLQEAHEYLQSLSFAEDFIVKKNVWIFASLSAFMRESMIATIPNLDTEIAARLKLQPFNAGRLYNK